jgi:hypothetical protein
MERVGVPIRLKDVTTETKHSVLSHLVGMCISILCLRYITAQSAAILFSVVWLGDANVRLLFCGKLSPKSGVSPGYRARDVGPSGLAKVARVDECSICESNGGIECP